MKLPISLKNINKTIKSNMWRWSDNKWNAQCACPAYLFCFILFFFFSHLISFLLHDIVRCSCFIMCSVFNCNWYIRWCAVASYSILYVQGIVFVVSLYVSHSVHFMLFVKWLHFHSCILFANVFEFLASYSKEKSSLKRKRIIKN